MAGIAALALTGCSQGSATSTDSSSSGESVTLKFQSLSDQPGTQAEIKSIVDEWNTEHKDIHVDIVQAGWDGTYDKLVTQFTGGTAPDIIHFEASSIVPFANDGYLADLTDKIPEDMKKDVPQGIWDSVTVDGKIIAYPSTLQSYMVFANTKALKDAGVAIPTGDTMSWDEFEKIAKSTTKDGKYGVAWGLGSPTATMMSLAQGFDGDFFDGEGKDAKISVGDGEVAVPKRIHDMAYDDRSLDPTSLTQKGSAVLAQFYAGNAAMTVQGSFQAANIAKDAPQGFEWTALPPLEGTAGAYQAANPQTYSVNVDSKNVDAATKFLDYFVSADNLAKLAKADALIPASDSARAKLLEQTKDQPGWEQILKSGADLRGPAYLRVSAYSTWKDTVATPAFQQYLANQITLDELKKKLQDGWDQANR